MKNVLVAGGLLVTFIFGVVTYLFFLSTPSKPLQITTYFSYSQEELESIPTNNSKVSISPESIYYWDKVTHKLVSENTQKKSFTEDVAKMYAYLTIAQRDFAALSYAKTDALAGSFDTLSKDVLCLFFKDDCSVILTQEAPDKYSDAIALLVLSKINERIEKDQSLLKPYDLLPGADYWTGPDPRIGISSGNSLGFFIKSGKQFRAPKPFPIDSPEFRLELTKVKDILSHATQEQKEAVVFWAGGPGTKSFPGQLLGIADTYMKDTNVPPERVLMVRSILTMAVVDAATAAFDSKYAYLVKRPFMMDNSIVTVMPTPNHPSYPSGHSTLSAAAATILTFYFPENKDAWDKFAHEAGMSRVWGGIHYMMDHEAGVTIGTKVGNEVISTLENSY